MIMRIGTPREGFLPPPPSIIHQLPSGDTLTVYSTDCTNVHSFNCDTDQAKVLLIYTPRAGYTLLISTPGLGILCSYTHQGRVYFAHIHTRAGYTLLIYTPGAGILYSYTHQGRVYFTHIHTRADPEAHTGVTKVLQPR